MSGLFQNYKYALLDASFFSSEFTPEVKEGLSSVKILVANSFVTEIEQYKEVLPDKQRSAYEKNVAFLMTLTLRNLNLDSIEEKKRKINNDTWGMISLLVSYKAKVVVITSNKVLIQRIILNALGIDIFDLNRNKFVYSSEYDTIKNRFEIPNAPSDPLPVPSYKVKEQSVLFCKDDKTVLLGESLNSSGGEADLYYVYGHNDLIAKVFKQEGFSREKFNNLLKLVGMNEKLGISWAVFPSSVLYFDAACTIPVGFIEEYVKTEGNLDENKIYQGNSVLPEECLKVRQSTAIQVALRIVRQVCCLSSYGFFISDYNIRNFATVANNDRIIQMWDTDSFGYLNFFSKRCDGNLTSREYDTSNKLGAIEYCIDALYVFIFSLFCLGDPPISERDGKFKYDRDYVFLYRKKLVPENLWEHFTEVFRGEKSPSAETLLYYLSEAYKDLMNNPSKDKTYGDLLPSQLTKASHSDISDGETIVRGTVIDLDQVKGKGAKPKRKIWPWILIIILIVIIIAEYGDIISSCTGQSPSEGSYSMGTDSSYVLQVPAENNGGMLPILSEMATSSTTIRNVSERRSN